MKEIRRERIIPSYTIEEVTFIADDGEEFRVMDGCDEARVRRQCELYNKSLDEAKLKRAFDKLHAVWLDKIGHDDENGHWIGVVNNDDEWDTVGLYMKQHYCYTDSWGVDKNRPCSYPASFIFTVDCDYCDLSQQLDDEKIERNADGIITEYAWRPTTLQEFLAEHMATVSEIEKQIARLNVE